MRFFFLVIVFTFPDIALKIETLACFRSFGNRKTTLLHLLSGILPANSGKWYQRNRNYGRIGKP